MSQVMSSFLRRWVLGSENVKLKEGAVACNNIEVKVEEAVVRLQIGKNESEV